MVMQDRHDSDRRQATLTVAASDSLISSRRCADYVCDGANDEVEIQAAITALPVAGGKVRLLEGLYNISAAMNLKSNVTVSGMGRGTQLKLVADIAATSGMLNFPGDPSYITIKDLFANLNEKICRGLTCNWGTHAHFVTYSHLDIEGALTHSIAFESAGSTDITIKNCRFMNSSNTFVRICLCDRVLIEGNYFTGTVTAQLAVCCGAHLSAIGNIFDKVGLGRAALWIGEFYRNSWDILIVNNIFNDVSLGAGDAIEFLGNGGQPGDYNLDNVEITGNIFRAVTRDGITNKEMTTNTGILSNVNIHDNIFETCGGYGIHFITPNTGQIKNLSIKDNQFISCASGALSISDTRISYIAYRQHPDLFMDVLAVDTNHVVAAQDLTAAPPIVCGIAAQPDVPRNITITITDGDASISAFQIDVVGVNAKGQAATEQFLFAGGLVQTGNVAWATITSVTVTSITGDNAGDILDVGIGSKLGLSNVIYVVGDVYKVKKNTADWPAASYTVNATYHTVNVSTGGAIIGGDDFTVFYRSNLNIVS